MGTLIRDIQHGLRLLVKQPGFTLAALAVLALGIGANTAIFSLVNAFLLKPILIHNPEELMGAYSRDSKKPDSYRGFSYPAYAGLREHNTVFSSLVDALRRNDRIEIRGFGSFVVKQRRARDGRNPKTGSTVSVAAKRVPFFKVGKELKLRVDGKLPHDALPLSAPVRPGSD